MLTQGSHMALFNLHFLLGPSFLLLHLTCVIFSDNSRLIKISNSPCNGGGVTTGLCPKVTCKQLIRKKAGRLCMWSGDSLLHPLTGGCVPAINRCYFWYLWWSLWMSNTILPNSRAVCVVRFKVRVMHWKLYQAVVLWHLSSCFSENCSYLRADLKPTAVFWMLYINFRTWWLFLSLSGLLLQLDSRNVTSQENKHLLYYTGEWAQLKKTGHGFFLETSLNFLAGKNRNAVNRVLLRPLVEMQMCWCWDACPSRETECPFLLSC